MSEVMTGGKRGNIIVWNGYSGPGIVDEIGCE